MRQRRPGQKRPYTDAYDKAYLVNEIGPASPTWDGDAAGGDAGAVAYELPAAAGAGFGGGFPLQQQMVAPVWVGQVDWDILPPMPVITEDFDQQHVQQH